MKRVALCLMLFVATVSSLHATEQTHVRTMSGGKIDGDVTPGMVEVPAGEAILGIDKDLMDDLCHAEANDTLAVSYIVACYPRVKRDVAAFQIDTHELTYAQYKAFLDATGRKPGEELSSTLWTYYDAEKKADVKGEFKAEHASHAMGVVSHDDASACARWMGRRLPTEEEWTRAARGDEGVLYAWGNEWDRNKCANGRTARGRIQPVMRYKDDVSWCGVYDLMGNVTEWTSSRYHAFEGFRAPKLKVAGSRRPRPINPPFAASKFVAKGGTAQGRDYHNSGYFRQPFSADSEFELVGFRTAKDARPGKDALDYAVAQDLVLIAEAREDSNALDWNDIGAQEITRYENHKGGRQDFTVVTGNDHLAFAHVDRKRASKARLTKDTVEKPEFIGLFTSSKDLAYPDLPAGSYAVFFKAKGVPKDERGNRNKDKEDEEKKAEDGEKEDDKKKGSKKSKSKKSSKKDKKSKKDEEAKAEEESKAEGESEEGEAAEGEEAEAKEEEVERELPEVKPPYDRDVILIKAGNGSVVAWLPIENALADGPWTPATFSYGAASPDFAAEHPNLESAKYDFVMKGSSTKKGTKWSLEIGFQPGSFKRTP